MLDGKSTNLEESLIVSPKEYYFDRKYIPDYEPIPMFPIEVLLDVTSFCNHACTFCVNPEIELKKTVSRSLALQFIQEAYTLGSKRLGVFGTGESFIYKGLHEYIKEAKRVGFEYVYIKTNGALCTPQRVGPVLDAGLDSIRFSIHAGTQETYKKIQGKDDFWKVIQNVKDTDRYRREKQLSVEIAVSLVLTELAKGELELLKSELGQFVDVWDIHELNSQCGNLLENRSKGELVQGGPRYDFVANKCKQPFSSLSLTPEGYISACIMDFSGDLIVGDYNEQDLKSIWEGETYVNFRNDHLNNNLENHICFSCIYAKANQHFPLTNHYSRNYRVQKSRLK